MAAHAHQDDVELLLRQVRSLGVELVADGHRIRYRPVWQLDEHPELLARLRDQKDQVLELLIRSSSRSTAKVPPRRCWSSQEQALVDWFLREGSQQMPSSGFQLSCWLRVVDPVRFREALLFDVSYGPDGPRGRSGALMDDLARLRAVVEANTHGGDHES